jgi:hypothetical protein
MSKFPLALACCLLLPGVLSADQTATVETANFSVEAATPEIAKAIARSAERLRKEKALEWFGRELPNWATPCPIRMGLTLAGYSHTDFSEDNRLTSIVLEGSLEHVLNDTLPHEMMHAVLVPNVGFELPIWADEGAAVLSSSEYDRDRFDDILHRYYHSEHFVPLQRLFQTTTYPRDWVMLYAEGYSITRFLVKARDRKTFLAFLTAGQRDGWEHAVQKYYAYPSTAALERAWLQTMSWTGRKIITRKSGIKIGYTDARSGKVVEVATLDQGVYVVLQEKGDWIKVRHRGVAGWLPKDDTVLLEKSVAHFTQRIRLLPEDHHALAYRGLAWLEKGNAEQAVNDLNTAIQRTPHHATWYLYRGKARIHKRDYVGAGADFVAAVFAMGT